MLKYVRGDPLSADHWLELFRLLKMPKGTTLEKLTFGNILDSAEEISAKRDELKVSLPFLYAPLRLMNRAILSKFTIHDY